MFYDVLERVGTMLNKASPADTKEGTYSIFLQHAKNKLVAENVIREEVDYLYVNHADMPYVLLTIFKSQPDE